MSVLIEGLKMPKGNSTVNVLIYADGHVVTGSEKDSEYHAMTDSTKDGLLRDLECYQDAACRWLDKNTALKRENERLRAENAELNKTNEEWTELFDHHLKKEVRKRSDEEIAKVRKENKKLLKMLKIWKNSKEEINDFCEMINAIDKEITDETDAE